MKKLLLFLLFIPLVGVGQSSKKQLESPYKLSKGIIDYRLFTFINSDNFYEEGTEDLQKMIRVNDIKLNANTIEDLNEFPGRCACCDMEETGNGNLLYFKEGKVLIIEKYYNGDFESVPAGWYDCYIYNSNKRKFENKLTLRDPYRFAYNYNTNYVLVEVEGICDDGDPYYRILNNKLENVGEFSWGDIVDNISNFYWNEERNEMILEGEEGELSTIYENINGEWVIKNKFGQDVIEGYDEPFFLVDQMPLFGDCEDDECTKKEILKFISKTFKYPKVAKENGIEGRIILEFVVEKCGHVDRVKVLRGLGKEIDQAAIESIRLLPKFIPGKQKGIPVNVKYTIPIKCTLG
jgi:TonB family protein